MTINVARQDLRADPLLRVVGGSMRLVLAGLVIGLLVGLGVVLRTPALDQATATLELTEASLAVDLSQSPSPIRLVTVDTDAIILFSDAVVDEISQAVGQPPSTVRDSLSLSARPITRVIDVSYTDPDPQIALRGAEAAATAFLRTRADLLLKRLQDYLDSIDKVTQDPTTFLGASTAAAPSALVTSLENRRQRAVIVAAGLHEAGRTLVEPRLTVTGDRGDIEMPLATGGALGALLGMGIAMTRTSRRRDDVAPVAQQPPGAGPDDPGAASGAEHPPRRLRRQRKLAPRSWREVAAWTILLALAGTVCGALAASQLPRSAVARTSFLVQPLPGNAFSSTVGDTLTDLRTEAELAGSTAVLDRARSLAGSSLSPEELRRRISVGTITETGVVVVTVRATSGAEAAALSTALARATLDERAARAQRANDRQAVAVREQIEVAEAQFTELLTQEATARELRIVSQRLTFLRQELSRSTDSTISPGDVVQTVDVTADGNRGLRVWSIVLGALVGAIAGLLTGRRRAARRTAVRVPGRARQSTESVR